MPHFEFASCVPFASDTPLEQASQQRSGVLFRAACQQPVSQDIIHAIEQLLHLKGKDVLHYQDRSRHQSRSMRLHRSPANATQAADLYLSALLLTGDTSAEVWLKTLLQTEQSVQAYGRLLLVPGATPPVALAARSPQICTCFSVTEEQICQILKNIPGEASVRFAVLQEKLKCGTNCGSCIPELKRLIQVQSANMLKEETS